MRPHLLGLLIICFLQASHAQSYPFQPGATQCYDCLAGTVAASSGSGTCSACNAGYYQDLNHAEACKECPLGTYNPNPGASSLGACIACLPGSYSDTPHAIDASACHTCSAGKFRYQSGASSSAQCLDCPAGTFSNVGASNCTACDPGRYSANPGSTGCLAADAGYKTVANTELWAPECVAQPASCITSSPNKITLGSTQQEACPSGAYSPAASTTCTSCQAGTYLGTNSGTGEAACLQCPAGSWSAAGAMQCTPCGAGYYGDAAGATSIATCHKCPAGSWSGLSVTGSCSDCGAGRWSDQEGLTALTDCSKCPAGTWSNAARLTSSADCIKCEKGSYSITEGATGPGTCLDCPAGTWSDQLGINSADLCTRCGVGTYLEVSRQSSNTCIPCDEGTYSQALGANNASTCQVTSLFPSFIFLWGFGLTFSLCKTGMCPWLLLRFPWSIPVQGMCGWYLFIPVKSQIQCYLCQLSSWDVVRPEECYLQRNMYTLRARSLLHCIWGHLREHLPGMHARNLWQQHCCRILKSVLQVSCRHVQ